MKYLYNVIYIMILNIYLGLSFSQLNLVEKMNAGYHIGWFLWFL